MTKEVQKSTKCGTWKVQNFVPFSPNATPWTKINTKFFAQSPPTRLQTTHTNKHIHALPINPQSLLESVLTLLRKVLKLLWELFFVLSRSSRCKLASLLFVVNSRMNGNLLKMFYKIRIFKSTASNLTIDWRQ